MNKRDVIKLLAETLTMQEDLLEFIDGCLDEIYKKNGCLECFPFFNERVQEVINPTIEEETNENK